VSGFNVTKNPTTPEDTVAAPSDNDLDLLAAGRHYNPHSVLGAHPVPGGTAIRALKPDAEKVIARVGGVDHELTHVAHGLFSALVPVEDLIDYRLVVTWPGGHVSESADGYRFLPTLGELDLHLFGEGRHERLWDILGAHQQSYATPDGRGPDRLPARGHLARWARVRIRRRVSVPTDPR
jgi:1,4-alpha-glucan branching enzyme